MQKIGYWAFIIGVIIAVIAGAAAGMMAEYAGWILFVLVILGLIVGLLNVGDKEIQSFLIVAIALMAVGSANLAVIDTVIMGLGSILQGIVGYIAVFVAPAALVVALKAVYSLGSTPAVMK